MSAIGAAEALNFGAPKKIDGEGGINLVKAAQAAGVQHFVMVSSLGTGKFGWPAGKHHSTPFEHSALNHRGKNYVGLAGCKQVPDVRFSRPNTLQES